MYTEARKRASEKYNRDKVRRVVVAFSPVDADLVEYLEGKDSMGGYLKKLLREDYERNGRKGSMR
uniref:Uncharacterized protein n=1 Tax=Muribaculaceae bacterium Z82 TaxID=2304548 RepID=A0A7C9NTH6_9BACT